MAALLLVLQEWPVPREDLNRLRIAPEWDLARQWGWIMESGELTGIGSSHAPGTDNMPLGILPR